MSMWTKLALLLLLSIPVALGQTVTTGRLRDFVTYLGGVVAGYVLFRL